jgi:hypothetical protein
MKWGINEIEIIPAAGSSNAEKNNKDSVIDMVYPLYAQLFFCFPGDLQGDTLIKVFILSKFPFFDQSCL